MKKAQRLLEEFIELEKRCEEVVGKKEVVEAEAVKGVYLTLRNRRIVSLFGRGCRDAGVIAGKLGLRRRTVEVEIKYLRERRLLE